MCLKQKCVATFVTNNTVKITLVTLKDNKVNITLLRGCLGQQSIEFNYNKTQIK